MFCFKLIRICDKSNVKHVFQLFIADFIIIFVTKLLSDRNMKTFCFLLLVCITNILASFTFLRSEKILLHTDHSDYRQGDTISFSGTLLEATTLEPSTYSKYVYIELINREDSVLCRQKYKCDSACFKGELFLETDLPSGNYYLRAYTRLMQNFSPTAFTLITIPVDNLSTTRYSGNIPSHVYFYPEGGHLLSGSLQNVAFEVKDENGLPIQTTASLCKGSSDTVYSNLVTDSYGIGSFSFIPDSSSLYYIRIGSHRFPCPSVTSVPVLQLNQNRERICYNILFSGDDTDTYSFMLFHRGAVCLQQKIDTAHRSGVIPFTDYTSGLIAGILLDKKNRVVSETLIYYDSRRSSANQFTTEEKAALLNSDLSRPIPDLALCMDSTNKLRTYLLTRKWGRFMWQDILQDSYDYLYKPEDVLALSGYVETESGRPLKKGHLIAINNDKGFTYDADILNGRFVIGVDDFKEGESFFLQAYNEKGKSYDYKIIMDNDTFPGVVNLYKEFSMGIKEPASSAYIDSFSIYHLPSITVTARIKEDIPSTKEFYGVNYWGEKEFENPPYPNIIPYLERMIGFEICEIQQGEDEKMSVNEKYEIRTTRGAALIGNSITRNGNTLVVLLDGYVVDTTWALESLHPADIRSIERLTPAQALRYTSLGFAGAILIRTKGNDKVEPKSKGLIYAPGGLSDI